MAAEWGGLSIGTLLRHGLLDKRREIGSISVEATASAVLRRALEVEFENELFSQLKQERFISATVPIHSPGAEVQTHVYRFIATETG